MRVSGTRLGNPIKATDPNDRTLTYTVDNAELQQSILPAN